MITGLVTQEREAVIALVVRSLASQEILTETVIDTGFNGFLTLPAELIAQLSLSRVGETQATLGDGSSLKANIFEAKVLWDSHERDVVVLQMEGGALAGMSLLWGYRLMLEGKTNGRAIVEALP
jgi:clan AA aspartic protease